MINPRQGYLMQWNNVPSMGWTAGDGEARERQTGPFHRSGLIRRLVSRLAAKPTYDGSKAVDRRSGTTAQQRPLFGRQLRRARRGSKGKARALLTTLIEWDGSYSRADSARQGGARRGGVGELQGPGRADRLPQAHQGLAHRPGRREPAGQAGHLARVRHLQRRGLRAAHPRRSAACAGPPRAPTTRCPPASATPTRTPGASRAACTRSRRRAPRPSPDLPFFDRGTWEQSVHLGR